MRKLLLILVFLPALLHAQVGEIQLKGVKTPESVKIHNGQVFVSNLGNPDLPNDGFIIQADLDGANQVMLFEKRLDSPKGYAFLNSDIMLIADQVNTGKTNGKLVLADVKGNKILAKVEIAGSKFLNDVAFLGGNTFIISDTGANKLYEAKVDIAANKITYSVFIDKIIGPNGIVFDAEGHRLFIAGSTFGGDANGGQVYKLALPSKEIKNVLMVDKLGTGKLDGIYYDGDFGSLYVSDWGDKEGESVIYELNPIPYGSYIVTSTLANNLSDIADFDIYEDTIYAPQFTKNQVNTIKLGENIAQIAKQQTLLAEANAPTTPQIPVQQDKFGVLVKILGAVLALAAVAIAAKKALK